VLRLRSIVSAQVTDIVVLVDQFGVTDKKGQVSVGSSEKCWSSQVSVPVALVSVTFRQTLVW
jgi:hypothetical protein